MNTLLGPSQGDGRGWGRRGALKLKLNQLHGNPPSDSWCNVVTVVSSRTMHVL
jgi:hypothetical protein